jgi:hypothetical protein
MAPDPVQSAHPAHLVLQELPAALVHPVRKVSTPLQDRKETLVLLDNEENRVHPVPTRRGAPRAETETMARLAHLASLDRPDQPASKGNLEDPVHKVNPAKTLNIVLARGARRLPRKPKPKPRLRPRPKPKPRRRLKPKLKFEDHCNIVIQIVSFIFISFAFSLTTS